MKIAVSSTGEKLEDFIDRRFERCNYFLIVDTDTLDFKSIFNNGSMRKDGTKSTAMDIVLENNVEAVITGDMRPEANEILSNANIKVMMGINGEIRTTIKEFKLNEIEQCPKCGSINLDRDYTKLKIICKNCGLKKEI